MTDSPSKGELMRHRVKSRSLHIRVNVWDGPRVSTISVELYGEDDFDEVNRALKEIGREAPIGGHPKEHAEQLAACIEMRWPLRGYTVMVRWDNHETWFDICREPAERV